MGASRKLQGEIDRVLKKVQEGVDVFDSIWKKVYDTDNANQKEKFEADLKKEIKKLQRYRDQIKTWIQSNEIKDKKVSASYEQALIDARKLIEREMERFKVCEKETKTKAFSKEGLGQQPKTDPKEKAKSETQDWLRAVVVQLASQIESFEAEVEGLTVKKGKARPPRLAHLETSLVRHRAHQMKLELILRLLDNDELSPEQVNDVKDFVDDYVERNQEDFDEFDDVDELYSSLPLDKVEALEETIGAPSLVAKAAPIIGLKGTVAAPATSVSATTIPLIRQPSTSVQDSTEGSASQDSVPDPVAKTPPPKSSVISSSTANTPSAIIHATSAPVNIPSPSLPGISTAAILSGSNSLRASESTNISSSPVNISMPVKEEDLRRVSSPSLGRGGIGAQSQSSSVPLSPGNTVSAASDMAKRNILGQESLVSPISSSRMVLPQVPKGNDGVSLDSSSASEAAALAGRAFSPPMVPGMQWRPGTDSGSRPRAEYTPDMREKFLQKFQHVQQHVQQMPPLSGANNKQFSSQQQNPLLQPFNSQNSAVSQAGVGLQTSGIGSVMSSTLQQQTSSVHQLSNQPALAASGPKESEVGHTKVEEQLPPNPPDESVAEAPSNSGLVKNLMNEDELKAAFTVESPGGSGVPGSSTEQIQVGRDVDLSPGQPLQASPSSSHLGVIGRRSMTDLGAIGYNVSGSPVNSTAHDQAHNLLMLDAAYYKLPQPKDSERARSYTPKHPMITPPFYPQVQAPNVNNPAYWERLGLDSYGTDTLFFAFYYQQNTYQQYLAAKELKRQSWRYHRKYNTWFQRHEEPKVATDEYEQGTYVYFDFHTVNDEQHSGWCQRIKTDFTFEYNYLEDDLII